MIRNAAIMLGLAALAVVLGWAGWWGARPAVTQAPVNPVEKNIHAAPVPDITARDLAGRAVRTADLAGRVVVINFWATWCAPCVKEMPALMALAGREKSRLTLLAVSVDTDQAALRRFIERIPGHDAANVHVIADPDKKITQGVFQTYRYPETVLVDARGMMRDKIVGGDFDWLGADAARMLDALSDRR